MKPKHHDLWDRLLAFINYAHDECSKMVARGQLGEFEREWHDPIDRLSKHTWFADAKAVAKTTAEKSVLVEVRNIIQHYRFTESILGADFG